jgi:hypothetical protein
MLTYLTNLRSAEVAMQSPDAGPCKHTHNFRTK